MTRFYWKQGKNVLTKIREILPKGIPLGKIPFDRYDWFWLACDTERIFKMLHVKTLFLIMMVLELRMQ